MNLNIVKKLKKLFLVHVPRKIAVFLCIIKIFSKIECRFTSNKKNFTFYKNKNFLSKYISYYKEVKYVKSSLFEKFENEKISEDYIVLLDFYPYWREAVSHTSLKLDEVYIHYRKLRKLLSLLENFYKKKIVITLHPAYPEKFYEDVFPGLRVYKHRTVEFINKAFIVLFVQSSAIIHAILKNKKILLFESDLFKKKEFESLIYKNVLGIKSIKLSDNYVINKKEFINDLDKKVRNYSKYKNNYFGHKLKKKSSEEIYDFIKNKYLL